MTRLVLAACLLLSNAGVVTPQVPAPLTNVIVTQGDATGPLTDGRDRTLGPGQVVIGHHHGLEERPASGDPGEGIPDPA